MACDSKIYRLLGFAAVLVGTSGARLAADQQAAEKGRSPRLDLYGDPLPPGALTRLSTVRLRHDHIVQALAFSPDGKTLASGGFDYTVRLWNLSSRQEIRRLGQIHARSGAYNGARLVHAVAYSPDGKKLAAALDDNSVHVWEAETGKELFKLTAHQGPAHCVLFSPDGKLFATGSADQS